jgi:hypothetical protein
MAPVVSNLVTAMFYLALSPGSPAQPVLVATAFSRQVNDTSGWNALLERPQMAAEGNLRRLVRHGLEERRNETELDLILLETMAIISRRDSWEWWWLYTINYECVYQGTGLPVNDSAAMQKVTKTLPRVVQSNALLQELQATFVTENASVLDLSLDLPEKGPSFEPTLPPSEDALKPVDPRHWDAQRWLGLGLFVTVTLTFTIMSRLAWLQKQKRERKQLWGQVGTVEGVDELLRTGWHFKGNRMEIYDHTGVGYRDDDSVFLGGYEQKEVIGVQVSLTHPETGTARTPDSPGNNS